MLVAEVTVAEKLRECISGCELSHTELGKATGVPQPTISRFMRGERGLNLESIESLIDYFGLELTEKPQPKKKRG
jgi:plasmid maintenance system antidote protein VapI